MVRITGRLPIILFPHQFWVAFVRNYVVHKRCWLDTTDRFAPNAERMMASEVFRFRVPPGAVATITSGSPSSIVGSVVLAPGSLTKWPKGWWTDRHQVISFAAAT